MKTAAPSRVPWRFKLSRATANIKRVAKSVVARCYAHGTIDTSAQVSFYFVLSLFPFLLVLAGFLGWIPTNEGWTRFANWFTEYLPVRTQKAILHAMLDLSRGYGKFLSFGLIFSLWSASTGFLSLMDALNK